MFMTFVSVFTNYNGNSGDTTTGSVGGARFGTSD